MTRVIIQGEEGSNSSVAARALLGADLQLVCCTSFEEAFAALDRGEATLAVLPFENSTAGLVPDVAERLIKGPLFVIAETSVSIRFVAAARVGATRIERILAHPMAAAQCQRFLGSTGWQVISAHDTAGAARLVSESDDLTTAAICPVSAASRYGLHLVHEHCGDDPNAMTRFFLTQSASGLALAVHQRSIHVVPTSVEVPARAEVRAVHRRDGGALIEVNLGADDPRCIEVLGGSARAVGSYRASGTRE